jgi:outer membrane lipoprotein-sorting protein
MLLIFAGLTYSHPEVVRAQDATEIVDKAVEKMSGQSSKAEMQMKIVRPGWQRTISLSTWSKGTEFSMILVTAPAREEGTSYLKRQNEIWNWVPRIGRTVKLPPSMMKQSWMGSDFRNDDLIEESSMVTDYSHMLVGDSTINDRSCYHIEMTPKPTAPVVWGQVDIWISKQEYLQLRTEFYNEDGELVDILEGSDIREMDGRVITSKFEMIPADKQDQRTVLEYESINFDIDISEDFFTVQNMKRLGN